MGHAPNGSDGLAKSPHEQAKYCRKQALTVLLPVWPQEIDDTSVHSRARLLVLLRKALRAERQRGKSGHWTYDLARHRQLLAVYRKETGDYLQLLKSATCAINSNKKPAP